MLVPSQHGMGSLDLSLKPPKWLRNAASTVLRTVGVQASVPTPAGPVVLDSRDAATVQSVKDAIANTRFTVGGRRAPTAGEFIQSQVPGGYGTLAIAGLGVLALVMLASRGRR